MAGNVIDRKALKKMRIVEKFFKDEKGALDLTNVVKRKMDYDISNVQGQVISNLRDLKTRGTGWIGSISSALVNSSPILHNLATDDTVQGDVFGPGIDSNDSLEDINVKLTRKPPDLPGAEIAISLEFQEQSEGLVAKNLKKGANELNHVLTAMKSGGELQKKDGETIVFNASRGQELTMNIEEKLSEALEVYFVNNLQEIDRDLHREFEEWFNKKGVKFK